MRWVSSGVRYKLELIVGASGVTPSLGECTGRERMRNDGHSIGEQDVLRLHGCTDASICGWVSFHDMEKREPEAARGLALFFILIVRQPCAKASAS